LAPLGGGVASSFLILKFNFSSMKKIFTFLFLCAVLMGVGNAQTTAFTETFDNAWYAVNIPTSSWSSNEAASSAKAWHRNDVQGAWSNLSGSPIMSGANSTSYYARYHSWNISTGATYISTGDIDLSTYTNCSLTFYYINPTGTDKLDVYFSNDGGSTWGSVVGNYVTQATWNQKTIAIPSGYQVSNFRIKFNATSDFGNDDIGLDEVVVKGTLACTTPATPATATASATGQETADLSWTAGTPAGSATVTYYWAVGTGSGVTYESGYTARGTTTSLSASASGLTCNTAYYMAVKATTSCDATSSAYKTSSTFTTSACSGCTTPGTPATASVSSPGLTSASLAWTAGTAGSPTVTYYWAVGTANTVTYESGYTDRGTTSSLSASTANLDCGTTYYLAVRAQTSCNATSSGYKVSSPFSTLSCALDPCANATPLVCGVQADYVALASSGGVWDNYTGMGGMLYPGTEKVWSFTPTVSGLHSFVTTDNSGNWNGTFFLMSSCSNTSTNLGGSSWNGDGSPAHLVTLTAGITYYLIADVPFNTTANVSAKVTCPTTDINMSNGTTNIYCGTTYNFYDSGGSGGDYGNGENLTHTFTSSNGNPLTLTFTDFNTLDGDKMTVYDGVGIGGAALLVSYYGSAVPAAITSTSASLTVVFTSDVNTVAAGWKATVTCEVLDVSLGSSLCNEAVAFCPNNANPGVDFQISNSISNAPSGQCGFMKNPTWWYMKVASGGDFDITIASSCGDVDFACYGPFANLTCDPADLTNASTSYYFKENMNEGLYANLHDTYNPTNRPQETTTDIPFCSAGTLAKPSGKLVDFGGSTSQTEYLQIRDALVDQYYIVLIGNYSHCAGSISFTQTNLGQTGAASANCDIVVPVNLIEFDAECLGNKAAIHWQTVSEKNNNYFILEKRKDEGEFYEIGRLQGAGNSNILVHYNFVDENMFSGVNYYRLKQVDYDGGTTTYKSISLNCESHIDGQPTMQVYPNPFKDAINVVIQDIDEGDFTLEIVDELGRVVYHEKCSANSSEYRTMITLNHLQPAVYNLRYSSRKNLVNLRLIKQ